MDNDQFWQVESFKIHFCQTFFFVISSPRYPNLGIAGIVGLGLDCRGTNSVGVGHTRFCGFPHIRFLPFLNPSAVLFRLVLFFPQFPVWV